MKYSIQTELPYGAVSHNHKIKKQVIIGSGEVPHITNFSQAIFPPGEVAIAHAHLDMWEVFFVQSGTGIIKINEQEYLLKEGVCVTVEPEERHEIINTGKGELIITYFGVKIGQ